jgi:hypothetical protein
MEKQVVVLSKPMSKKHSVRYDSEDSSAAVQSIYLMRTALGSGNAPKKIKITIEEAS